MSLNHLRIEFAQQLALQAVDMLQPLYILVDPLVKDPVNTESAQTAGLSSDGLSVLREQLWGGCPVQLIEISSKAVELHQMPYLVCLSGYQHVSLAQSVDLAVTQLEDLQINNEAVHCVGGWVQSAAQPLQLAQTLAELMIVVEHATCKRYLRLCDPRVLQLAQCLLQPMASVANYLGCISKWYYVDELQHQLKQLQNTPPNHAQESQRLPLTQQHWLALTQAEVINRALATWQAQKPAQARMSDARQRVIELARKVRASGWQEPSDQLPLVLCHLLYPRFEQSIAFRNALELTRTRKGLVGDALKTIPTDEWARLQAA